MKIKHFVLSSIFWRSLYFATVLLLNIVVSRYFKAAGTGWLYYIINYFSLALLVISLNLETGMAFFASKKAVANAKLATFSLTWTLIVGLLTVIVIFFNYKQSGHGITRLEFLGFALSYIPGVLLTTFFSSLFYAQQRFALPNIILSVTNCLLMIIIGCAFYFDQRQFIEHWFLYLFFLNYLLQGLVLYIVFAIVNKVVTKWSFPNFAELSLMVQYSLLALLANVIFFLLYRADYWFIQNICTSCNEGDLGNYIQVSKLGQLFLLVPSFVAAAIFPRTAAGFRKEINSWLPVLTKALLLLDLVALLFLVITGKWLFPWLYGNTFDGMYIPFLLLIPGIFSLSTIAVITAYNAGKDQVLLNVKGGLVGLILIITGDCFFIPGYGIKAAAAVSSIGYTGYLVYLMIMFKKEYHVSLKAFFIPVPADWKKLQQIFSSNEAH